MADYTTLTDSELMVLLNEGKQDAFKQVYDRYYALLFVHA